MSKDFKCEACRKSAPSLHMRDLDGKWVCAHCIPERELAACRGLRERLGLRSGSNSIRGDGQRKKAA